MLHHSCSWLNWNEKAACCSARASCAGSKVGAEKFAWARDSTRYGSIKGRAWWLAWPFSPFVLNPFCLGNTPYKFLSLSLSQSQCHWNFTNCVGQKMSCLHWWLVASMYSTERLSLQSNMMTRPWMDRQLTVLHCATADGKQSGPPCRSCNRRWRSGESEREREEREREREREERERGERKRERERERGGRERGREREKESKDGRAGTWWFWLTEWQTGRGTSLACVCDRGKWYKACFFRVSAFSSVFAAPRKCGRCLQLCETPGWTLSG